MAYTALTTKAGGDTITTSDWSALKDNFEAGVPDIFTTAGDMAYATGNDAAVRLGLGTVDSVLVAGSTAPEWQLSPSCRMQKNSNQTMPAAWTTVTFLDADTTLTDPDNMHTNDSTRLTIPANGAGFYTFGGCVKFDASGDNTDNWKISVRISLNGTDTIAVISHAYQYLLDGQDVTLSLSSGREFAVADYIELQVYTLVACDILNESMFTPVFWASWQRRPE